MGAEASNYSLYHRPIPLNKRFPASFPHFSSAWGSISQRTTGSALPTPSDTGEQSRSISEDYVFRSSTWDQRNSVSILTRQVLAVGILPAQPWVEIRGVGGSGKEGNGRNNWGFGSYL